MTDKQYEVAEFETDSTSWNFKEDYNVLDEMVGANLARNINNQQLKKFYPNIPIDDYEESEDWHRGFSRGKQLMLEATRHFLAELFNKPQEEIDTVLISQEERPYLDVNVNGMDEILNEEG
jgi:hypothetical protein